MDALAVDPGLCTGIARLHGENFTAYQLPWFEAMDLLTAAIWEERTRPDVVICERFDITGNTYKKGKSNLYEPLHGIGVLKWATYRAGVPFVLQAPADAMRFAPNEALKTLGWYTPGKEHGRDATRHLVKWLAENGHLDLKRLLR